MARDNHPRIRQATKIARKAGKRKAADRILIVSEGSKTEPNYFTEMRQELRLPTANIFVTPCEYGTSPLQVVDYANDLFQKGNPAKKLQPKSFEKIFAVFDRDDHIHYFDALSKAQTIQSKNLRNDVGKKISFTAIPSVPSFEFWLLLHYQDITTFLHRDIVLKRLCSDGCLPQYEKGCSGVYSDTNHLIEIAKQRAKILATQGTAWSGVEPYTDIHFLVDTLYSLKK